jgi:NTE family protein
VSKIPRIGLALGGGGARGLAHLSVLRVLEENDIPIAAIAGTSIGSIIGASYALEPNIEKVQAQIKEFLNSPKFQESGLDLFKKKTAAENFFGQVATYVKERIVINLAHSRPSLVGAWRVTRAVETLLAGRRFEDCRIPFSCVATDLRTGEEVVFRKGELNKAVQASMSIPGFLPPVEYDGHLLVDGAVLSPVPVLPCRALGVDVVIAVEVGQRLEKNGDLDSVIDIVFRASSITTRRYTEMLLEEADIIIRPEVGDVHWSEFSKMPRILAAGEAAAKEALPEIRRLVKPRPSVWQRLFGS